MTSVVTIEQVKLSTSGKSLSVRASGGNYFAKKDSGLMDKLGWTIEAETEESVSPTGGKPFVWITKWKKAADAPAAPQPSPQYAPNAPAPGVNMAYLPFVSNVVAHAISAGNIDGPAAIAAWANAAYTAACNLEDATNAG